MFINLRNEVFKKALPKIFSRKTYNIFKVLTNNFASLEDKWLDFYYYIFSLLNT